MEQPNKKQIGQMNPIELARILQRQFQEVSQCQQKIMQCQQNIWSINLELDKQESVGDAKPTEEKPKPEE